MPKKSEPEKLDFSPKINIEPRLESVQVNTIQINPDKMYRKRTEIDQAEINKKILLHEAKNIIESWGGEDNYKTALKILNDMKIYFKPDFNLNDELMKVILEAQLQEQLSQQKPTSSKAEEKIKQIKKVFETLLNSSKIINESGTFIRKIIGKYPQLNRVESHLDSLIPNIESDLTELIYACENCKITGDPGKPKKLLSNLLPLILNLWKRGTTIEPKSSRSDDNKSGSYKGKFFDFVLMLDSLLTIKSPNLSLGSESTIGKKISDFLSSHKE